EDYELSSNESVANYHNFSESSPADEYLAEIIDQLFLAEPGAEVEISYDFYNPLYVGDTLQAYELDTSDYTNSYNNFDDYDDIYLFLQGYISNAGRGDIIDLTYRWYDGYTDTLTNTFVYLGNDDWSITYVLNNDDYEAMGMTNYPNFSDIDVARHRIAIYLETLNTDVMEYQYAEEGDEAFILYDLYDDGLSQNIMHLNKGEYEWNVIGSLIQKTAALTASSEGWSFVPPIEFIESDKAPTREYTLTESDYELVGNGNYYNFDVRPGANEELLSVRIDKISTILKANFSDLAVGDVFLVHYDIYNGSNETWDITLEAIAKE
ncbi:hypothetical protein, partial [Salinivirga cyanobacteriivorans]